MIVRDKKIEKLRREALDDMKLSAANRELAEAYMDGDGKEEERLLKEIEPKAFTSSFMQDAVSKYLVWLKKRKQTEELKRFLRLLAVAGGSTAGLFLVNFSYAELMDWNQTLEYLEGEQAAEQKTAIRAAICAMPYVYVSDAGQQRKTCMEALFAVGKEEKEIYLRALKLCYGDNFYTKMLLLSLYLHVSNKGEAPAQTQELEKIFFDHLTEIFQKGSLRVAEIQSIRTYILSSPETPFPERILKISRRLPTGTNLKIFAGCAFLALPHSERFEMVVRLMVSMCLRNPGTNIALDACIDLSSQEWFDQQMEHIEDMLPILDEDYLYWCLRQGQEAAILRMSAKSRDGIQKLIPSLDYREYPRLLALVKKGNPDLYQELYASSQEVLLQKRVDLIAARLYPGREEAKQYLLGKAPFSTLLPYVMEWDDWYQDEGRYQMIQGLREDGDRKLYQRMVTLEGFRTPCFFFAYYPLFAPGEKGMYLSDSRQLKELLRIADEEQVPVCAQMEMLGLICENFANLNEKSRLADFKKRCVDLIQNKQEEWGQERWESGMQETLTKGRNVTGCCLCLEVLECFEDQYRSMILSCVTNSKKKIREQAVVVCARHKNWEREILDLFDSKKLKEREFALLILEEWGTVSNQEKVKTVFEQEKNQKLKDRLQEFLKDLEKGSKLPKGLERKAAGILTGARKKKVEWVLSLNLPEVHDQDGQLLSQEYLLSILALYADMEEVRRSEEVKKLSDPLNQEEFAVYVQDVYEGWLAAGAEAKKRWVLYLYAFHGKEEVLSVLSWQLGEWADHSRGAIAAETVRAIALRGSTEALLFVDQISRKHKSRQVKNAAVAALADAAQELGISREELEDQLVPDLGFDDKAEQIFDYGSRTFTVRLSECLEAEIYDENGKCLCLNHLPRPGKKDEEEKAKAAQATFRQMKKQLKTVADSQKIRLLQALRAARLWEKEQWEALFIKNPVMHQFAMGLIWGVYEDRTLTATFRYMEDGSFNTAENEPYTLSDTGKIGIVHPLELDEKVLTAWKEHLLDYEVGQPFDQLSRPVFGVSEDNREEHMFDGLYGKTLEVRTLSGKLLGAGWYRGKIEDAGFFSNYYRKDGSLGAELTFSGCSVGYENPVVTVYSLYFYRLDTNMQFHKKNQMKLFEVPARDFSEVVPELVQVVGDISVHE